MRRKRPEVRHRKPKACQCGEVQLGLLPFLRRVLEDGIGTHVRDGKGRCSYQTHRAMRQAAYRKRSGHRRPKAVL